MPKKNSYLTATDQFCGAGGSTSGAKAAGIEVKLALNHWKLAIETHNTNHPDTAHDCTDISACDPRRYPSTDILITSPECTTHSPAGGNKHKSHKSQIELFNSNKIDPATERSRATMWDVCRFAEYHNYNLIITENVVEAKTRWELFDIWLMAMHKLGYNHQCVYFNSMFAHPCPQSRDRMYIVFWKKGNPAPNLDFRPTGYCNHCGGTHECYQSWKNPARQFGKFKTQYIYRCANCNRETMPFYYAAFNCIDWSLPGQKIGDRKAPLVPNTLDRIRYGLEKYKGLDLVVTSAYTSIDKVKPVLSCPMPTQTAQESHNILMPYMVQTEHSKANLASSVKSALEALHTQTSAQGTGFVVPFIVELNRTGKARSLDQHIATVLASGNHHMLVGNYSPGWTRKLSAPTGTVTTDDHHALFSIPLIIENKGQSTARPSTDPLSSVTTHEYHGLLTPEKLGSFLSYYNGGSHQASSAAEPINAVTTVDRAAIISAADVPIEECYYRMLRPHEIQAAMAFQQDYVVLGNSRQKVKQLGNAVTPPVMEMIVRRCVESLN